MEKEGNIIKTLNGERRQHYHNFEWGKKATLS